MVIGGNLTYYFIIMMALENIRFSVTRMRPKNTYYVNIEDIIVNGIQCTIAFIVYNNTAHTIHRIGDNFFFRVENRLLLLFHGNFLKGAFGATKIKKKKERTK